MQEIRLTQGYVALVDDEDYEKVAKYKWSVKTVLRKTGVGLVYAGRKASGDCPHTRMHRFLLNIVDPKTMIDHVDHNGLNNQKCNLRISTSSQNQHNSRVRVDNTSGFKGVCWHKQHGKWCTRIQVEGKMLHVGLFTDPLEAACAYDMVAVKYYGKFASTNFAEAS